MSRLPDDFFPDYNQDKNYQLNAKSFFHYLGKSNKALKYLSKRIWEYDKRLNLTLKEIEERLETYILENDTLMDERLDDWDERLEKFPDNVETLLQQWLTDGTLDHIINETIFNWKVDQSEFDEFSDKTTSQLAQTKTQGLIPVTHYSVIGDGIEDDTQALQNYITIMEETGIPYMYFPNFEQNYLITDSLKFTDPDIRIFGDKGLQMLHPSPVTMKNGNIYVSNTVPTALDLGNYRTKTTSNNPAGSWTVEGLSFITTPGESKEVSNGVTLSGLQNGPDRPIILSKLSFNHLKYGVYMPPAPDDVSIMVANLKISDISAYRNDIAIKLEGETYGASIVNNNLEGNLNGCVHGVFNGYVNISENMLENTKNPVKIETAEGGSMYLLSIGNYFEYHVTSDYLYHVDTGVFYGRASIDIDRNITSGGINMEYPVVLTGDGRTVIKNSQFKVLFEKSRLKAIKGSQILGINGGYYAFNQLGNNTKYKQATNMMIYMDNGFEYIDNDDEWVHDYPTTNTKISHTPLGEMDIASLSDGIVIDQPVKGQGEELIVVNLMVKSKGELPGGVNAVPLSIDTASGGFVGSVPQGATVIANDMSDGEWVMVSIPLLVNSLVNSLKISVKEEYRNNFFIAGATSKNYGFYNNQDVDLITKIYPVRPNYKASENV